MRPRRPAFKTETRLRRSIFQTLETETFNPQDRDETETFHFPKLSRPRRDVQPSRLRRGRDVPKNIQRPQCRSLKTLTGEVCHLTTCFLQVRSIIAWMFTRLNSRDRDVISSLVTITEFPPPPRWLPITEPTFTVFSAVFLGGVS